jgi:Flp pilus assembly protein protease CpaA
MGALGAIAGPLDWVAIFAFSAVMGGLLALGLVLYKKRFPATLANVLYISGEIMHARAPHSRRPDLDIRDERALTLPRAVSVALGTFVFLLAAR